VAGGGDADVAGDGDAGGDDADLAGDGDADAADVPGDGVSPRCFSWLESKIKES